MPPLRGIDDEQLAAILTYVRSAWGHEAAPVPPDTLRRVPCRHRRTHGGVDRSRAGGARRSALGRVARGKIKI
jgi:hypothetical protein